MTILINVWSTLTQLKLSPILLPSMFINKKLLYYNKLRPFFGWLDADIIKNTFDHSIQYTRLPTGTTLRLAFRSPNPALNVVRQNEAVACDIVYSNVPAIDDDSTTDTQVTDVYGIKTDKQFINTLEDNITNRGAPSVCLLNT
jgi:hypothetical protein